MTEWPDITKALDLPIEHKELEDDDKEVIDKRQLTFGYISEIREQWRDEWQDMPEFEHEDLTPYRTVYVHFESEEDIQSFAKLVDQKVFDTTKFIWYPKVKIWRYMDKRYVDEP